MQLAPPAAVREIARRLEEAGFPTYAVGGAVRDALLGLPAQDWDLATRARPQEVRRLFRRTAPIGIEHGTVGVLGKDGVLYEVTTFRRDVETFGRHATVEFAETIEDDLSRRDFTINALAWDPATGELRDPFGGLRDLGDGILRTVGEPAERFAEDYLRVLRALRFAGHFRLRIEERTWAALVAATPQLAILSAERVREELMKVLGKTRCASAALSLYAAAGVLGVLYPELEKVVETAGSGSDPAPAPAAPQPGPAPEPEPAVKPLDDPWALSLRAVDSLPPSRPVLRLAALLHAVGMPAARTRDLRGGWRYTGHEQAGGRIAQELLRRLKASNAEIERVGRLVRHQSDLFPPDARSPIVRRWMLAVGPDLLDDLWRLRFALARARDPGGAPPPDLLERWRMARFIRRQRAPLTVGELAISGADLKALGLRPGPRFGEILRILLDRVLDEPKLNTSEQLLAMAQNLLRADADGETTTTASASVHVHVHDPASSRAEGQPDDAGTPQPQPQPQPQPRDP